MVLTQAQLLAETGVTVDDLARLIRAGIIRPDATGKFEWHDAYRVRMVRSYLDAGISLKTIEETLRRQMLTFDYVDQYFLEPGPLSGRSYRQFADSLGEHHSRLGRLYETLGLPEPDGARPMRTDEEDVVGEFVEVWSRIGDQEILDRAARLIGDHLRRAVDGWLTLWVERMTSQTDVRLVSRRAEGDTEAEGAFNRQLELSHRLASLMPRTLVWLEQRLLEQQLNAANTELFERGLAELGLGPPPPDDPPAIVFVDLAGFTRLTEEHGDEVAVRYGGLLRDAASGAAARYGGRLVKLLGDGAMLYFPRAESAVAAAVEMVDQPASWPADLPPAHVGIHAGTVIERDGDYFGRTVNLAARLSGYAPAGTAVVTADTVAAIETDDLVFERLGRIELRNVPEPVDAFRARSADRSRRTSPRGT